MSKKPAPKMRMTKYSEMGLRKANPFVPATGVMKGEDSMKMNDEASTKYNLFKEVYIDTPIHTRLYSQIDYIRLVGRKSKTGPQCALRCLAPSYSGKSTVAERYASDFNSAFPPEAECKPVIYVTLENNSTSKKMIGKILEALGDAAHSTGTEAHMRRRLVRLFRHYKVELLILDEIHHLVGWRTCWEIINSLKAFLNERLCALVLLGTHDAMKLLTSSSELAHRITTVADINPLSSSPEDRALMAKFLVKMDAALQRLKIFDQKSDFLDKEVMTAIHRVSGGVIGVAACYLRAALDVAVRRRASRIERFDIFEGIETWAAVQKLPIINPFLEAK